MVACVVLPVTPYILDQTCAHVCSSVNTDASIDIDANFARAIVPILAIASASSSTERRAVGIAYSGGLDSSALLHLMHRFAAQHAIDLFAFHIHHGLSAQADHWLDHCAAECAKLTITFAAERVQLVGAQNTGVEAAARTVRYAALGALCRQHQVPLLLTAHHQDDQAETVLLQLLRGSGVAGLSGMDSANHAPDLLGDARTMMARPLLGFSRGQLAGHVAAATIDHVDDASNSDTRYARNALRHQVMPALAEFFPEFQARVARSAMHAQAAQRLLVELAALDLAQCVEGDALVISKVRLLGTDRIDNLLRYWFGTRNLRMPSTAWLAEMREQLFTAKADAQLCVTHADCHIRRHRDRVFITPRREQIDADDKPRIVFAWHGEASLPFVQFGGTLSFDISEVGVPAKWLREQALVIGLRSGGERLKPAANRPTRALKYHYQAAVLPAWERERLPVVASTTVKHLLYAAGIGMDCRYLSAEDEPKIALRWQFDAA